MLTSQHRFSQKARRVLLPDRLNFNREVTYHRTFGRTILKKAVLTFLYGDVVTQLPKLSIHVLCRDVER